MTRISTKDSNNGRNSAPQSIEAEQQIAVSNYSSDPQVFSSPEPPTISLPELEDMEPIAEPPDTSPPKQQKPQRSTWSLQTKAAALAIAIGTIPVLLTGFIAYQFANQSITREYSATKITRATSIEDKVLRFMRSRYGDIQILANLPILTEPTLREITPVEEKQLVLDDFVKFSQVYNSIAVFDLNGDVIVQSEGDFLLNHSDRDYFQTVIKTNKPFISKPLISKSVGILSIYFAAPVKDQITGKTIAVIRARMPIDALDELIANFGDQGDEYHLVDFSDGVGKIFLAKDTKMNRKETSAVFSGWKQLQAAGETGSLVTTDQINNSKKLLAYAKFGELAGLPELKWEAVVTTPAQIAFAPQRQLFLTLTFGTGFTALAVGAIASNIANRATRPLLAAADAVEKIGQGELDTQLAVQGEDELAVLGANINDMAAQLKNFVQKQALATEQAQLLAEVTSTRSVGSQALQEIFETTVKEVRKLLNADRAVIYRFNPYFRGEVTAESVASDLPSALDNQIQYPPLPSQLLETYQQGVVVPTNDLMAADLTFEQLQLMEILAIKATIEIPILHESQLFAVLSVHHCAAPHDWQPSEITFLQQLAAQLKLSVDRVILLEQTEKLAQEQRQLKEKLQRRAFELLEEVDPVGRGDLTIRANVTQDEIGTIADSYNSTVENLRQIVIQVQAAASQVTETTSSNEPVVRALSQEALRQTKEIAMALNRAQEMDQSVQLVAASAQQAQVAVQQAAQTVEEGDAVMNQTVEGIIAVRDTVSETAKKVKRLGESSQRISAVVKLINTFAAQTNLLALNASMEAARAGEEGRGFAVVANQVRSLARQSAEATAEIKQLVAGIQAETNEVVAAMEAGTEQVAAGTKLVEETRQSLNKITLTSAEINTLVEAIAQATVVQSAASESVTKTMTDVAAIASQTSTEASTVSSSFEQLQTVAQLLQQEVGRFKVS
ncbi:MAG: GAF domain-containing protein [Symploca sp. SIO2G7]|nr:GAF domain-containing protein [Symploca sp. SIO2G7]